MIYLICNKRFFYASLSEQEIQEVQRLYFKHGRTITKSFSRKKKVIDFLQIFCAEENLVVVKDFELSELTRFEGLVKVMKVNLKTQKNDVKFIPEYEFYKDKLLPYVPKNIHTWLAIQNGTYEPHFVQIIRIGEKR